MQKSTLILYVLLCLVLFLSACDTTASYTDTQELHVLDPLPPPESDGGSFGVDVNINMSTIDDFLDRSDVAYFDLRMFYDTADNEATGGVSTLTRTLPGFRIVPFPHLATLSEFPAGTCVEDTLFFVIWGEAHGEILMLIPIFGESRFILRDIFPQDKAIFLMCGGAGYSALARSLLIHEGWDESLIYIIGDIRYYEGSMGIDMTISDTNQSIATWRADYAFIDFYRLTPIP